MPEAHTDRIDLTAAHAPDEASARRPMPIAHVWSVCLIALMVGSLLNAPGIHKTALSQPVGWKRDVATFFAGPLYDVSRALYLDRLRGRIQDAIGRHGDDDVNPHLPSPTLDDGAHSSSASPPPGPGGTSPSTTPTTQAPKKPVYTTSSPMRLWVGGDSLSVTPGESLINLAPSTTVISALGPVDGHVSTGLARPEVFNWAANLATVMATMKPNVMVLTIGSNDDQTLTGDGGGAPFGSQGWIDEYRRRVGGVMDQVTGSGATLFWVGIPPVSDIARYQDRYRVINQIVEQEASRRPGKVVYVDMGKALGAPDSGYSAFVTNPDGSLVQVRTSDGTHMTRAGGDRIAQAVYAAMGQTFDLRPGQ
jgi:hypothetical protein